MEKKIDPDRDTRASQRREGRCLLREGERVLVRRIRPNDPRQGTLAVCDSGSSDGPAAGLRLCAMFFLSFGSVL